MVDYWLDSNVFIEGKKGPYGFDIAPRFWSLMDELIADNRIACPAMVYKELLDTQDDLATWIQNRRASGLFTQPDIHVQETYRGVVDYVMQGYPDNQARRRFLDRADPWVIAHAIAQEGTVVSLEGRVRNDSQQVKIPNVCDHFGVRFNVRCVNTYQMLRELGVSWNS